MRVRVASVFVTLCGVVGWQIEGLGQARMEKYGKLIIQRIGEFIKSHGPPKGAFPLDLLKARNMRASNSRKKSRCAKATAAAGGDGAAKYVGWIQQGGARILDGGAAKSDNGSESGSDFEESAEEDAPDYGKDFNWDEIDFNVLDGAGLELTAMPLSQKHAGPALDAGLGAGCGGADGDVTDADGVLGITAPAGRAARERHDSDVEFANGGAGSAAADDLGSTFDEEVVSLKAPSGRAGASVIPAPSRLAAGGGGPPSDVAAGAGALTADVSHKRAGDFDEDVRRVRPALAKSLTKSPYFGGATRDDVYSSGDLSDTGDGRSSGGLLAPARHDDDDDDSEEVVPLKASVRKVPAAPRGSPRVDVSGAGGVRTSLLPR